MFLRMWRRLGMTFLGEVSSSAGTSVTPTQDHGVEAPVVLASSSERPTRNARASLETKNDENLRAYENKSALAPKIPPTQPYVIVRKSSHLIVPSARARKKTKIAHAKDNGSSPELVADLSCTPSKSDIASSAGTENQSHSFVVALFGMLTTESNLGRPLVSWCRDGRSFFLATCHPDFQRCIEPYFPRDTATSLCNKLAESSFVPVSNIMHIGIKGTIFFHPSFHCWCTPNQIVSAFGRRDCTGKRASKTQSPTRPPPQDTASTPASSSLWGVVSNDSTRSITAQFLPILEFNEDFLSEGSSLAQSASQDDGTLTTSELPPVDDFLVAAASSFQEIPSTPKFHKELDDIFREECGQDQSYATLDEFISPTGSPLRVSTNNSLPLDIAETFDRGEIELLQLLLG